jgi:hypothetical protein
MYGYQQRNVVMAQQDGSRYSIESFDQLLDANGVEIAEDNREQVARAFALMALANHLQDDVTFTDWQAGEWPARFDLGYQYRLTAWTKIQGYQVDFFFGFMDYGLMVAWGTSGYEVGEYVEDPTVFPPQGDLTFFQ